MYRFIINFFSLALASVFPILLLAFYSLKMCLVEVRPSCIQLIVSLISFNYDTLNANVYLLNRVSRIVSYYQTTSTT